MADNQEQHNYFQGECDLRLRRNAMEFTDGIRDGLAPVLIGSLLVEAASQIYTGHLATTNLLSIVCLFSSIASGAYHSLRR